MLDKPLSQSRTIPDDSIGVKTEAMIIKCPYLRSNLAVGWISWQALTMRWGECI
jgi:hypothetical protein